MVDFTVVGFDSLVAKLKSTGPKVEEAIMSGMTTGMQIFQSEFETQQLHGRPGLNTGTAQLKGSFITRRNGDAVTLSSSSKYAAIHQYGGTIHAKDKLLTVPASPEAKNHFASEFNLVFVEMKSGLKGLMDTQRGKFMYWLKDHVDIPKRLTLIETFNTRGIKLCIKYANQNLNKILDNLK